MTDWEVRRLVFVVVGIAVLVGGMVGAGVGWLAARVPMVRDWRV